MNRVVWGLVALMALGPIVAVVVLGVSYRSQLLEGEIERLSQAPKVCWGLGRSTLPMCFGPEVPTRHWIVVGCFAWRVEEPPPSLRPGAARDGEPSAVRSSLRASMKISPRYD